MTDKLSLYNGACVAMGTATLASLTVTEKARFTLDTIWDGGALNTVLEQGLWNHAMRTIALTYDSSITPSFGYAYGFTKPDDLVRIATICSDERFECPLMDYQDNGNTWFADLQTIYIRYISNGASYGADYSLWPATFTRYFEHYLALRAIKAVTDAKTDADDLKEDTRKLLSNALAKDAQKEPTRFRPESSWNASRRGSGGIRRNIGHGGWS